MESCRELGGWRHRGGSARSRAGLAPLLVVEPRSMLEALPALETQPMPDSRPPLSCDPAPLPSMPLTFSWPALDPKYPVDPQ